MFWDSVSKKRLHLSHWVNRNAAVERGQDSKLGQDLSGAVRACVVAWLHGCVVTRLRGGVRARVASRRAWQWAAV